MKKQGGYICNTRSSGVHNVFWLDIKDVDDKAIEDSVFTEEDMLKLENIVNVFEERIRKRINDL
jgi:hypothetical protein